MKIKIDLSDLEEEINEIHTRVNRTRTYAEKISKEISLISKDVISYIDKEMIDDNTLPYAPLVRLNKSGKRKTPIKFKLPPRLSKIRKRTHNLKLSLKVKRGEGTNIANFQNANELKFSIVIVNNDKQSPYTAIQNYGGIIKPKNARNLTIPIHRESFGKSPRRFTGLIKRGKILYKKEKRGLYRPMYLLKKSVKLKGFHFIENGIKNYLSSPLYQKRILELKQKIILWYLKSPKNK